MLVDLRPKNLTGKVAEKMLDQAGITVNKNTIPDDPQSPFVTSGIRLGTPALTTRGMGPGEMERIAELIDRALTRPDEATLARVREEVEELSSTFPLYQSKSAGRSRPPERLSAGVPPFRERPVNELQFADDVMARIRAKGGEYHERAYLFVLGHHRISPVAPRGAAPRERGRAGLGLPRLRPGAVRAPRAARARPLGRHPDRGYRPAWCSPWWRSGCW